MKTESLTINIWSILKRLTILTAGLFLMLILQRSILVSPSHPFIDENGDGLDDFEQNSGRYQDPAVKAKIYGVTFPIAELGNCGDYLSCRTYCEDPLNSKGCIDYGRNKGFYQGESDEKVRQVLTQAKTTLGCDSYEACQNFCEIPANFDKCSKFSRSQGIVGGHVEDPSKREIVAKAKEVLGCSSEDTCKSFCGQEANAQKCFDFAKQVGLHGGERAVGPGGCTSEATCKSFCSDPNNFQICKGFHDVAGGQFSGPGGCNSAESCRTYCQQNEAACSKAFGGPGGAPPPGYNPSEMCNKTPNCSWTNNGCQCGFYGETKETIHKAGEYAAFCQTNPEKCRPGESAGFGSTEQRREFEDYCTKNPDKCKPPAEAGGGSGGHLDPAAECARYGCSWTNNTCQCSGITPYSYPTPAGGTCPAGQHIGSGGYCIPEGTYSYPTPTGTYSYPSPSDIYSYPSPTGTYSYPTPTGTYSYPSPTHYSYPTPYGTPTYGTPSYSYPSPTYGTPSYGTPSYSYPSPSYGTPSYGTPSSYPTPSDTHGISTSRTPNLFELIWQALTGK